MHKLKIELLVAIAVVSGLWAADSRKGDLGSGPSGGRDWPAYGGGAAESAIRPSNRSIATSLKQINRYNVGELRVAWTYDTADGPGDPVLHLGESFRTQVGSLGVDPFGAPHSRYQGAV